MHYNRSTAICSRSGCKGMEEKENASYFSLQGTETRCDSDIKKKMDTKLNRDHKEIKEKKGEKERKEKARVQVKPHENTNQPFPDTLNNK